MRAARIHEYGPAEVLKVEEVPRPEVRANDVIIEVHASSVNPVDWKIRDGGQKGIIRYSLPWTLGLDVSGVVVEVGRKVSAWKAGDEVFASPTHRRQGCYAEYVAVDQSAVARKPASITHGEAASLPLVALTAYQSLVVFGKVQPGHKVLVHAGSGGVGSVAIQIAKRLGAEVATTCSTRNLELVTSLGADHVVDYTKARWDEVLEGYDLVVDALGGEALQNALKVLKRGGRIASLVASVPAKTKQHGKNLGPLLAFAEIGWFIARAQLGHGVRVSNVIRRSSGEYLAQIAAWVDEGAIRPLIDRTFALDEIAEAHRYSESGRARGKIVIAVR